MLTHRALATHAIDSALSMGGPSQYLALFRWFWARDLHERDRGPHEAEPRVFQDRGLAVRCAGPV